MFIICVVTSNRSTTRPVEEVCWPILMMNLQWQDIEFPDSGIHSTEKLITDHKVFYYTKGLLYTSMILLREGGMKKAENYHVNICIYCYKSTKGPAFIFVITLFPPATKQDQVFI